MDPNIIIQRFASDKLPRPAFKSDDHEALFDTKPTKHITNTKLRKLIKLHAIHKTKLKKIKKKLSK